MKTDIPFQKRASSLRDARKTLALWQKRLKEMEEEGERLTDNVKSKYLGYHKQLERQISKTQLVVLTFSSVNEQKWENARLHAKYMWEAMEDTWAYWKNLPKNE